MFTQLIIHSLSCWINQLIINQSIIYTINYYIHQSITQLINSSINPSIDKKYCSINRIFDCWIIQSIDHFMKQYLTRFLNQPILVKSVFNQFIDYPITQFNSINRCFNRSNIQLINCSINGILDQELFIYLFFHFEVFSDWLITRLIDL